MQNILLSKKFKEAVFIQKKNFFFSFVLCKIESCKIWPFFGRQSIYILVP